MESWAGERTCITVQWVQYVNRIGASASNARGQNKRRVHSSLSRYTCHPPIATCHTAYTFPSRLNQCQAWPRGSGPMFLSWLEILAHRSLQAFGQRLRPAILAARCLGECLRLMDVYIRKTLLQVVGAPHPSDLWRPT